MKKILIVEDEVLIGMMLMNYIEDLGYQTCELATTAEEAFELVQQEKPDGIIFDIGLAGNMDGITTAAAIQKKWNIPFLFFTGHRGAKLIQKAQDLKPVAILDKMDAPDNLQQALKKMFECDS